MEPTTQKLETDGDNESSVFLSSLDSNPWLRKSESDRKCNQDHSRRLSDQKTSTFTKKPLIYSKSMMVNFISWLGLNEEEEENKGQQWRDLVRRRRMRNMIVGQYKDVEGDDDVIDACPHTPKSYPHITDPLARPGYYSQVSKISTLSSSKRATRATNAMRLKARESVWRMAFNGIKTALTPQVPRNNLHPLHPRSVTLHQIRMEHLRSRDLHSNDHLDNDEYLDDAFFDVPTPTAVFPNLFLPSKQQAPLNHAPNTQNNNITFQSTPNTFPLLVLTSAESDGGGDDVFEQGVEGQSVRRSLRQRRRDKNMAASAASNVAVVAGGVVVGGEDGGGVVVDADVTAASRAANVADDDVGDDDVFNTTNSADSVHEDDSKDIKVIGSTKKDAQLTSKSPFKFNFTTNQNLSNANSNSNSTHTRGKRAETSFYDTYHAGSKPHQASCKPDHRSFALRQDKSFQPMKKLPTDVVVELLSQHKHKQEATKRHLWTHTDTHAHAHTSTLKRTGRQIGKGFVRYLADLEYRKSRIDSSVKRQINSLPEHRPYFTFWCTFVQVLCYLLAVCVHDLAPFGLSYTSITEEVLKPNLAIEEASYIEENNVWIGLRQADLIHLGARYSGCMRSDELVQREVQVVREMEANTGCCIRLDGSGCYQASERECLYSHGSHLPKSSLSRWKTWSNHTGPFNRSSGAVCHQDPRFCMKPVLPPGKLQHEWPDDITLWPACTQPYRAQDLPALQHLEHLTCGITGRPCCIGVRGRCVITTREDCTFMRGYYHDDKALCSQVDCMQDVCGMVPFVHHKAPDQVYRLVSSLFIHAGVVHLLVTVVFQLTVMRDLEKLAGWLRICIIYLLSGIAGSLCAGIFLPHLIEAGPSGSQFGLLSCLFVEVIQNWYILKGPRLALLRLCLLLLVLFSLGLMPMVDNIAHIGGFVMGFMLSFLFLPYISFTLKERRRKLVVVVVCGVLSSLLLVGLVVMFYLPPFFECSFCHYLNCIPITPTLCSNIAITGSQKPLL